MTWPCRAGPCHGVSVGAGVSALQRPAGVHAPPSPCPAGLQLSHPTWSLPLPLCCLRCATPRWRCRCPLQAGDGGACGEVDKHRVCGGVGVRGTGHVVASRAGLGNSAYTSRACLAAWQAARHAAVAFPCRRRIQLHQHQLWGVGSLVSTISAAALRRCATMTLRLRRFTLVNCP